VGFCHSNKHRNNAQEEVSPFLQSAWVDEFVAPADVALFVVKQIHHWLLPGTG
jgi:hypothetical protein